MAHERRELKLCNLLWILKDRVDALCGDSQPFSRHVVYAKRFLLALDVEVQVAFLRRQIVIHLVHVVVVAHRAALEKAGRPRIRRATLHLSHAVVLLLYAVK